MHAMDAQAVVRVTTGLLQGTREEGVVVYRGVPFAQPPVGHLRFNSPQPPEPWSGVRDARRPGSASYQFNSANQADVERVVKDIDPGVPGIMAWPSYTNATYRHNQAAEDCLYLDIWVPESAPRGSLPVYVYYHGGANAVSSGSFALERGTNLAREGNMIVVRPNYRLGALGWVHFGLLTGDLPQAVNLGVQDQFAALKWVHENIAAFGGDPDTITIGGESAGATAVSHLLTNPHAHPYFRRAVLQSLSPFNPWCTQQRPEAVSVARMYLDLLRIDDPAQLRTIDPDRLLAVQNVLTRYFPPDRHLAWRPLGGVVDGTWVPQAPAQYLSEEAITTSGLEVAIGFAKDEWQFFRGHSRTVGHGSRQEVLAVLAQAFGMDGATEVYQRYHELHPDHSPGLLLPDIMSFEFFKLPSLAIARNLSAQHIPVHVFQFSYDLPGLGGRLRAVHTGDIPFLFRNHSERDLAWWPAFDGADREEVRRVSARMGELYASFIRTGDPGPGWPRFDTAGWNVLEFGRTIEPRPGLLKPEWDVFEDRGFGSVRSIENVLVGNVREALGHTTAA
ncbi:carboxylesterase/lipase family protein [Streptantibioticus cattleyicolor]|uniref:Carboxylic ester hydrolase n=1 Tax=Streptantibioticus cattleyicolor (strain ATCC 35852 / DSM 46488 / JCM 4925 / NBRC 14057 / NRRL 8057) TaxID=1003195 RepID=F8JK65_STREN|nr:carboxylesterase family protein [Streptantibioticus cattleyicolor]AEW99792.1 carboxylesterase [Streptantibioticus cattleyicolor NRRL 8057 = DSM 46488]CCB71169.1 putative Phenmedipham hydrolase [Streptantibioticus cattleyicolor NRRL 8057 = DSM 46488]